MCNAADCTLREAIAAANANPGPDAIHFNIGAGGLQTITLDGTLASLPPITDPVTIDGTTQPGAPAAAPKIELAGPTSQAAPAYDHRRKPTVRGLIINQFSTGVAVSLGSAGGNVVAGNYIGTDATGQSESQNLIGITISGVARKHDRRDYGGRSQRHLRQPKRHRDQRRSFVPQHHRGQLRRRQRNG